MSASTRSSVGKSERLSDLGRTGPLPQILSTRRSSALWGLRRVESMGNGLEEVLIGEGAAHHEFDAPRIARDDRSDFQ
jgi:hypothetical protein